MNFNQAKIISVYYNKGDRKPYDVNGKPIAYIGEEFIGSTEATTIRFYLGEDIDSSTATIVTKRADGERRLDICSKVGTGATSYYEVTLNEWYSAVKGKLVVVFKAYNGSVTFDDNENPTEILSVSGRVVVSDIFNLDIAYAPVADLVVPPDATEPYEDWFFALSTKLDKADSITVAGALPTLTGGAYDDRYFYIENEGVGRLYYINGSTAEEVVFQVGTLKLTATGNGELTADTGKLSFDASYGGVKFDLYNNVYGHVGQDLHYYGKASVAITKGQVVQFAGVQGDHYLIKPAVQSEINANPKLIMGLALQDIDLNAFGYVSAFGRLIGVDTVASGFAVGDLLWFNSSGVVAGSLTKTQPTGANAKVLLAVVVKEETGSSNNGVLLVRPTIEPKLDELQNVLLSGQANGDVLSYDGSKWINSNRLTTAETDISNIEDGTTIVAKANADKDGNEFDATYLKKATATSTYVPLSSKGVANGVAPLGADNKIPSIHLPGGVDDIKEFADLASFPATGEASIIYVALDTNLIYRWSGSAYVEISSSLALGTTSSTAFPGDRGLAVETLADDIVDGTQTLTDTRITNSATNIVPLIVNGVASTTSNLQRWSVNGSVKSGVFSDGRYYTDTGIVNQTNTSNAYVNVSNNGTIISRNINDTNVPLVVRKNQGTGNILELQTGTSDKKFEVDTNGWLYQNGTRLFHQTGGTENTFFGTRSGGTGTTGQNNTAFGNDALRDLTSGINNIAIGKFAGVFQTTQSGNVLIGSNSGRTNNSGNNTFIGTDSGYSGAWGTQSGTATNSTGIGYQAYTDKSNQMVFGNSSVSEFVFNRNASAEALLPRLTASASSIHKITRTSALTNEVRTPFTIRHSTSANMTDGFGTSLTFAIQDDANTENLLGSIQAVRANADNSGSLFFTTFNAGTETTKMTILPNGNVGIGTGSPVTTLSLVTSSNDDGLQIRRNSASANDYATLGFRVQSSDSSVNFAEIRALRTNRAVNTDTDLIFITRSNNSNTERLRIRDDGLVGINETSPSAQLQVKSGATNRVPLIVDTLNNQTANLQDWRVNNALRAYVEFDGAIRTLSIKNLSTTSNALIDVGNNGTNISRNIADTNPALIVNLANAGATGNIQVWQKAGSAKAYITNSGGIELRDRVVVDEPTAQEAFYLFDSVEDLFYVESVDGDVYNKNGTYGTISDLRLKENIVQARDYTEDLMKLNVVKYSFKKDHSETPTHLGFIAQEVEEVFPRLVETKKTKELEDMKQIKMSVLIPMLVKTIQELNKRVEELEAK